MARNNQFRTEIIKHNNNQYKESMKQRTGSLRKSVRLANLIQIKAERENPN